MAAHTLALSAVSQPGRQSLCRVMLVLGTRYSNDGAQMLMRFGVMAVVGYVVVYERTHTNSGTRTNTNMHV